MEDTEALQSLRTGKYATSKTCWDTNSRFLLRLTLHGMIAFLLFVILLEVVLFSVFYHKISDKTPITITPYGSLIPENDTLIPCVFLRDPDPLPGSKLCPTGGYCPVEYSCSIVADEDTQENTYVCLNDALPCGNLHYCTTYIAGLDDTSDTTFPAKISDVGISETFYLLSVIPTFLGLFLLAFMWITFNLWNAMLGDPFEPSSAEDTPGVMRSIREKYDRVAPANISSWGQCGFNAVRVFLLFLCVYLLFPS